MSHNSWGGRRKLRKRENTRFGSWKKDAQPAVPVFVRFSAFFAYRKGENT